jgi:hypothetical protein
VIASLVDIWVYNLWIPWIDICCVVEKVEPITSPTELCTIASASHGAAGVSNSGWRRDGVGTITLKKRQYKTARIQLNLKLTSCGYSTPARA